MLQRPRYTEERLTENVFVDRLTILSSSKALIWGWLKENRPWGLSLAAIIILACLAVGLISSPEVAEVRVSWYSRRSSGNSSSRACHHDGNEKDMFYGNNKGRHFRYILFCRDTDKTRDGDFSQQCRSQCTFKRMVAADCLSLKVTVPEIASNSETAAGVMFQNTWTSPKTPGPRMRLQETHRYTLQIHIYIVKFKALICLPRLHLT